jgi:antitoxin component YwqK of YwqJK toxin-antitoxin module
MKPSYRKYRSFRNEKKAFDETPSDKGRLFTENELDENGNIILTVTYGEKGEKTETVTCTWDAENRLTEETIFQHGDSQTQKRVFEYLENPHIIIERTIYDDGGESRMESTYNAKGKIERIDQYIDAETPDSSEVFTYDAEGQLISHEVWDCTGSVISEDILSYEGNLRKVIHREDGEETLDIHHLNASGHIEKVEHVSGDTVFAEEKNEFDEKGRLVHTVGHELGSPVRERTTAYDEAGNITAEEVQDHRHRRVEKVIRRFDAEGRLCEEERFTTFGVPESYSLRFEYE